MTTRWPHQTRTVEAVADAVARGVRRIAVTLPTGAGKTLIDVDLIDRFRVERGWKAAVYVHRRLLASQTSDFLSAYGVEHGVRAAGARDERHLPVQVCMVQTEGSRTVRQGKRALHDCDLAVWDEAHLATSGEAVEIMSRHYMTGATQILQTATPMNLGPLADELVVGAVNSELRACGALVAARHFAPEEPDCRRVGYVDVGDDLSESQQRTAMGSVGPKGCPDLKLYRLFGRVLEHWRQLNPEGKPTVLFAPGVPESVWFAEKFHKAGVTAAHIDGSSVWVNGQFVENSQRAREDVLDDHRAGKIKVVCNRFVLREGIDLKWAECGLLCTVFGSLQSYLQAGGRLLRACPETGKADALVVDFGGNYHRHGSLNEDRDWSLESTPALVSGTREERLRAKAEPEPYPCPECHRVILGRKCPECGWLANGRKKARPVVQEDGTLTMVEGDIYRPREVAGPNDGFLAWQKCYFQAKNSKSRLSFRQAFGLFAKDHCGCFPNPDWKWMPLEYADHFRPVADVPRERLR